MPTSRVFFALPAPAAPRAALARLARDVAAASGGRATAGDSIHLTLAFVGDVANERVAELESIGARVRGRRFALVLDRLGGFRGARVAWIAPSTVPPALLDVQQAIDAALVARGFAVDARPFAAHVTLARHCRDVSPVATSRVPPIEWPASAFALWQSSTLPGGARYRQLARWPLDG